MELFDYKEFEKYVRANYKLILSNDSSAINDNFAGNCDFCKRDVFLKVGSRWKTGNNDYGFFPSFVTFFIQCPNCKKQSFIESIVFDNSVTKNGTITYSYDHYKLFQLPTQNIEFETKDIPENFEILKKTILEAKFNLNNSQFMSATMMFRRGLQILAKDVLGALGKTLFKQLEWLQSNSNKQNINLTELFHDNSDLIRLVGNQSAHPDDDVDLHEFTEEDANAVHDLFILLINEVFVLPAKLKAMKNELTERRKIK